MRRVLVFVACLVSTPVLATPITLEGLAVTLSVSTSAFTITDTSAEPNAATINLMGFGGLFDIVSDPDAITITVLQDIPLTGSTTRLHFEWTQPVFPVADLKFLSYGLSDSQFHLQFSGGGFDTFGFTPYLAGDTIRLTLDDTAANLTGPPPLSVIASDHSNSLFLLTMSLLALHWRKGWG